MFVSQSPDPDNDQQLQGRIVSFIQNRAIFSDAHPRVVLFVWRLDQDRPSAQRIWNTLTAIIHCASPVVLALTGATADDVGYMNDLQRSFCAVVPLTAEPPKDAEVIRLVHALMQVVGAFDPDSRSNSPHLELPVYEPGAQRTRTPRDGGTSATVSLVKPLCPSRTAWIILDVTQASVFRAIMSCIRRNAQDYTPIFLQGRCPQASHATSIVLVRVRTTLNHTAIRADDNAMEETIRLSKAPSSATKFVVYFVKSTQIRSSLFEEGLRHITLKRTTEFMVNADNSLLPEPDNPNIVQVAASLRPNAW